MAERVVVDTVEAFVESVAGAGSLHSEALDADVSASTLYRGQADESWGLLPSLYREGGWLFFHERTLIAELMRVRPGEFSGMTRFDSIVKMQHYGLPTRLLDMTLNPLVALYFACHEEDKHHLDGVVSALSLMPVLWQENYAVRLIMEYIFEHAGPKVDFDRFVHAALMDPLVSTAWSDEARLREVALHYLTEVPAMAVRPSLANSRIADQDGAFLLFGMRLKRESVSTNPGTIGRTYLELAPFTASDPPHQLWHHTSEYLVPAKSKYQILKQLSKLGINRRRMFPELEYQARYVRDSVARQVEEGVLRNPMLEEHPEP